MPGWIAGSSLEQLAETISHALASGVCAYCILYTASDQPYRSHTHWAFVRLHCIKASINRCIKLSLHVLCAVFVSETWDTTKCGAGRICGAHRHWSVLITWLIRILSPSPAVCIQQLPTLNLTLTLILTLTLTLTLIIIIIIIIRAFVRRTMSASELNLRHLQSYSDHWSADRP